MRRGGPNPLQLLETAERLYYGSQLFEEIRSNTISHFYYSDLYPEFTRLFWRAARQLLKKEARKNGIWDALARQEAQSPINNPIIQPES